ncbi:hypothetical protein [Psychrosphaera algicola]|uniref:EF-hand domain-containing protein n=1 Tax=Psychrosphaera algicola TaxID=3023714 RepID=A0ABT5F9W2_9GAMM|nr:hypothetical protein [Psychrosphaera sp. G1-22]MDC2887653.1 hypothetical protein [Psychrosphaera sp. G1-22]
MEENKFFKLVWRFNGLIISVAGILAVGLLAFATYKLFQDVTRERTTRNIVNIEENAEIKENWKLGQFSEIDDGKILMLPLNSDQSFDRAYFSKSSNSTRNYLFINTDTSEEKWLFNHTDYLIERSDKLRLGGYNSKEPIVAILYQLVKLDSDHDNRLSASDLTTIAITNPDGSAYEELIKEVELIVDHTLLNKNELFLIYQKAGVSYSAVLNLNSRELTKSHQLPKVGL